MSDKLLNVRMSQKVDTEENWKNSDIILMNGEIAVTSESNAFKFGNGVDKWSDLPYAIVSTDGFYTKEEFDAVVQSVVGTAAKVTYSNTASKLNAKNVQAAIDEVYTKLSNEIDAQEPLDEAFEISYVNTKSELSAANVQDAIDEIDSRLDKWVTTASEVTYDNTTLNLDNSPANVQDAITEVHNDIPTQTSQLVNNSGFITATDIPKNISNYINDKGYITSTAIPTKVSAFTNDAEYITIDSVPIKVSELENDSEYITNDAIPTDLSAFTNSPGFISSVPTASASTLGGIKIGSNLTIDANGVLSAIVNGTTDASGNSAIMNSITANVDVGGVTSGTVYPAATAFETILNGILTKYKAPEIELTLTADDYYQVGTTNAIALNIKATKTYNDITGINIYVNGSLYKTITDDVADGGTFTETYNVSTNTEFYIGITDGTSIVYSDKRNVMFSNLSYCGVVNSSITSVNSSTISGLTSTLVGNANYTNSEITTSYGKILYAYPQSFGELTSIKDRNGIEYIDSYTKSTTAMTVNGSSVTYYYYLLKTAVGVSDYEQNFRREA